MAKCSMGEAKKLKEEEVISYKYYLFSFILILYSTNHCNESYLIHFQSAFIIDFKNL